MVLIFCLQCTMGHPLGKVMLVMADEYPSGCGCGRESLDLSMDGVKIQHPLYGLTVPGGLSFYLHTVFSVSRVFFFYAIYVSWASRKRPTSPPWKKRNGQLLQLASTKYILLKKKVVHLCCFYFLHEHFLLSCIAVSLTSS